MRACEKTTQTVKKYTNYVQCFLVLFSPIVSILNSGRGKTQTPAGKTHLLPPKNACRVAVTHGSVMKTHEIDVLLTFVNSARRI